MFLDSFLFTPELMKQLRKGYILADYTICTVNNESLPHARISTACMEQAKRFIFEIVDGQERRCRLITTSDMVDMIAENISAAVFLTEEEPMASTTRKRIKEAMSTKAPQPQKKFPHTAEQQQSHTEEQEASNNQNKEELDVSESKATLHETMQEKKKVLPLTAEIA